MPGKRSERLGGGTQGESRDTEAPRMGNSRPRCVERNRRRDGTELWEGRGAAGRGRGGQASPSLAGSVFRISGMLGTGLLP